MRIRCVHVALGAVALAVSLAAPAAAQVYEGPPTQPGTNTVMSASVSRTLVQRCETFGFGGPGFAPLAPVEIRMAGVHATTDSANAAGVVDAVLAVGDRPDGSYLVEGFGPNAVGGEHVIRATVTVAGSACTVVSGRPLPTTGTGVIPLALAIGGGLVVAGGALTHVGRRARRSPSAS